MAAAARYFLGVDGGATQCRARLRDSEGRGLAEAHGPAANVYVDFERSLNVVTALAEHTTGMHRVGPEMKGETALGLSLAGITNERDIGRIEASLAGWARVSAVNDAVAACVGANGLGDGGLIIAGTGSAGIARVGGAAKIIGGRGFHLGDDGSGARIGYEAMRAATLAYDGLGPMSGLSRALIDDFGDDIVAMVRWAATAKSTDYGRFAPRVFEAARKGELGAQEIVAAAARAIETLTLRVIELGAPRVAYIGGIAEPLREFLQRRNFPAACRRPP